MNLLCTFLASHLIPALEEALAAHQPEIQAAILSELEYLGSEIASWVKSKVNTPIPKGDSNAN